MLIFALAISMQTHLHPIDTLRIMTFNIWVGGTKFQPLEQTAVVIKETQSDIVGIQEPADNLKRLAEILKWNQSEKASILTRYNIIEDWEVPGARWGGAKIQLPSGQMLIFYNTHLSPYPYGPYEIRDGKANTLQDIIDIDNKSGRLPEINAILQDIKTRITENLPIVFTGDFNTPSHLDWIEQTRSRNFQKTLQWPVTTAIEKAGFQDAYRTIHPNPVTKPGFTWSPGYPVGTLEPNDVMDRIDYIFYKGNIKPLNAFIVGEKAEITDIAIEPWPSDHRAVLSIFQIQ